MFCGSTLRAEGGTLVLCNGFFYCSSLLNACSVCDAQRCKSPKDPLPKQPAPELSSAKQSPPALKGEAFVSHSGLSCSSLHKAAFKDTHVNGAAAVAPWSPWSIFSRVPWLRLPLVPTQQDTQMLRSRIKTPGGATAQLITSAWNCTAGFQPVTTCGAPQQGSNAGED